jgi:hypothetical protein
MRSEVLNSVLTIFLLPEGQVLLEQLDDGLGISEGLFIDVVNFFEGLRERLLTELARLLMVVHDLVVEYREVESEAEADWVAWIESFRELVSLIVSFECALFDGIELVCGGRLSNVSVIIADHLLEEGLGLVLSCEFQAFSLNCLNNQHAFFVQLQLDLLLVLTESVTKLLVFWVLLNGTDGTNGASLRSNEVLETNGK